MKINVLFLILASLFVTPANAQTAEQIGRQQYINILFCVDGNIQYRGSMVPSREIVSSIRNCDTEINVFVNGIINDSSATSQDFGAIKRRTVSDLERTFVDFYTKYQSVADEFNK